MKTGVGRDIKRVFNLMGSHTAPMVLLVVVANGPSALFMIGMSYIMKLVLEYFTMPESASLRPILLVGGALFLSVIYVPVMYYFLNVRKEMIMRDVRVRVFDHLQSLPLGYFDLHHSGDVAARVNKDTETFRGAVEMFTQILGTSVTLIMFIPYIFALDLRFGAISFAASVIATIVNIMFIKPMRAKSQEIHAKNAILSETITENVAGFTVIKLFGLGAQFIRHFEKILNEIFDFEIQRLRLSATLYTSNIFIHWINDGLLAILGCVLAITGRVEIGVVVATLPICTNLTYFLMYFSEQFTTLQKNFAGVDRLFELFTERSEPERFQRLGNRVSASDGICISDGRFGYSDVQVINGVSLEVERGRRIALVGDSGGGKSTLIKLIASLYRLDSGFLGYDGKEIADYTLEEWRDLVAYVPQDAYIFDGTIRENIVVSNPEASQQLIEEVSRKAHAHDFIVAHTNGYDTVVGERGVRLSGGERQRIAVARALLKDAPILLLDEATSSLDSESEFHVQAALEELMSGRTSVVVAHRLSTIESADEICVVKNGVIVERGTHDELISMRGTYAALYYRDFREPPSGPGPG